MQVINSRVHELPKLLPLVQLGLLEVIIIFMWVFERRSVVRNFLKKCRNVREAREGSRDSFAFQNDGPDNVARGPLESK